MALPHPPNSFNRSAPTVSGEAIRPVRYDEFQSEVIACYDKNIVAEARAGAGKTTMAVGFTEARKDSRFLYLCFGKANQVEAAARFGSHVECRTGHSLAYGAVGYKFRNQLSGKSWSARDFAAQMRLPSLRTAAVVQAILGKYFTSVDVSLDYEHLLDVAEEWDITPGEAESLLALSKLAWHKIQQPGSGVSMSPDAYLKMWALTNPRLTKYTHIVLDEGQDTNPVMARILEQQTHAHKLLIGDRHQSIFLFRGALNAMEQFAASGASVFQMPRTWRFGPEIAHTANELLGFFKGEQVKIIGAGPAAAKRTENKRAVLSRTNTGLYAEAAAVLGKNTHWMGGVEQYRLDALVDAYMLKTGRLSEIRDSTLRGFQSWEQFKDEAGSTRNSEARILIKLTEQYDKDIPYLVHCFRTNALATEAGANLVLSTAHKAKGMDWDVVQIAEDFDCTNKALNDMLLAPELPLSAKHAQEINLLYVAVTRARHVLQLNGETSDFLKNITRHRGQMQEALAKVAARQTPPDDMQHYQDDENEACAYERPAA